MGPFNCSHNHSHIMWFASYHGLLWIWTVCNDVNPSDLCTIHSMVLHQLVVRRMHLLLWLHINMHLIKDMCSTSSISILYTFYWLVQYINKSALWGNFHKPFHHSTSQYNSVASMTANVVGYDWKKRIGMLPSTLSHDAHMGRLSRQRYK